MNENLIELNEECDFIFDENIICPQDITATPERVDAYKEYYKIKYSICKKINPNKIAEIGVRAGYSAHTFLSACPNAEYVGFDANNGTHGGQGGNDGRYQKWAERILKDYNFKINQVDTQKAKELNVSDCDFFHVDGDHTTNGVMHDLDLAIKSVKRDGYILVDDYDFLDEVKVGVDRWIEANKDKISSQYIKSFRGEMLIKKRF